MKAHWLKQYFVIVAGIRDSGPEAPLLEIR